MTGQSSLKLAVYTFSPFREELRGAVRRPSNKRHRCASAPTTQKPTPDAALEEGKKRQRIILAARFVSRPGQQETKCLALLERALIRYFLSEGHDLVNKQGARLRRHEITSKNPRRAVPHLMFVDRGGCQGRADHPPPPFLQSDYYSPAPSPDAAIFLVLG